MDRSDDKGDLAVPLIGEDAHAVDILDTKHPEDARSKHWHPDAALWRLVHALSFVIGGFTFLIGSAILFFPDVPGYDSISAYLYIIGSSGFLLVDLQEFHTYTSEPVLRTNILLSASGSLMYLIGSVGFIPVVEDWNPLIGVWGFVLGSAFIGWSQFWKTHRIGGGETSLGFSLATLSEWGNLTAAAVELGAGVGAWLFFFGTLLYNQGPTEGPNSVLATVLWLWLAGSTCFTVGGCFLAFRHFVMRVS